MGLMDFLGLGEGTPQVPGLEDFVANLNSSTTPAYQNLLGELGAPVQLPNLPPEIYAQLEALFGKKMDQGMGLLTEQRDNMIGGNAAKAARLGQVGSTGHARMVGNTNRGYMNEISGMHTQNASDMTNTILQLRQALLGGEMQRMGFASQAIPGMMGLNLQGYGALQEGQKINQAGSQSIIDSLLGMGSAIPGIGSWLSGLGGGQQQSAGNIGVNANPYPYAGLADQYMNR